MVRLYELLFVINDDANIAIFDNETGKMIIHPVVCGDVRDFLSGYEDCPVMDIHTEVQFGIAVMNICIEV